MNFFNWRVIFSLVACVAVAWAMLAMLAWLFALSGHMNDWLIANGIHPEVSPLFVMLVVIGFFATLFALGGMVVEFRLQELKREAKERGEGE